ncbi:hypothetical protein GY45DRAFT_1282825, partial [Cubamyces sp. BRFM 1775]
MGERFQVFLIARRPVPGNRWGYRCIAALHHQWCYGTMPLQALHRFFNLLRQEENKAIVRDELRHIRKCLADRHAIINLAMPCPYISSLLAISWTTDLELQTYLSSASYKSGLLDVRYESCWSMGICVIDITDVDRPAYCFMDEPGGSPLSAHQYLGVYASHLFTTQQQGDANAGPIELSAEDQALKCLADVLSVFWALIELAGHPLVPAEDLRDA